MAPISLPSVSRKRISAPTVGITDLGVLPEGAAFDRSGRKLVVTAFDRRDAPGGALHVYGIEESGAAARLVDQGLVETPHGVHHVVIR